MAILAALRALLSVSDRTGLAAFARGLSDLGWELIATDGTRAALAAEGIATRSVEDVTKQPALLGGRVKTLHPKIHAALLARRDDAEHAEELKREGIEPIDLVVVNLYPFAETAAAGKSGSMLLDQIDVGGVTLLRAGAKNYDHVVVVSRPERYGAVLDELRQRGVADRDRLPAADGGDHQAPEPVRCGLRQRDHEGVPSRVHVRFGLGVRRDRRREPHRDARARRRYGGHLLRGDHRAGLRGRGAAD